MPQARSRLSAGERRRVILDAAANIFARDGYHASSVLEIATAAGITKAVLYDHFRSKEELFLELTKSARDDLVERGAKVMAETGSLERRMRVAFHAFFAFVMEKPAHARILLMTPKGMSGLQDDVLAIQDEATRRLALLLSAEEDMFKGDPDREGRLVRVTEFVKAGMHGLAEWWQRHPDVPLETLTDTMMDVCWRGLASHGRPRG